MRGSLREQRGGNMVSNQSQLANQQNYNQQQSYSQQSYNQSSMHQQNQQSSAFGGGSQQQQQQQPFGGQNTLGAGPPQAFSGQSTGQSPFGTVNSMNRLQHKGVPQVVPTVGQSISPLSHQQGQQAQNATGPNLMQKLNEITAPGGDILSKGKELIFMKFGLGGK